MDIKQLSNKYKSYVSEMRRYFHMYPELSMKEYNTSKVIKEELKKIGIPYETYAETGVIGTIICGHPGKTLLLRADMDALEVTEENDVDYKSKTEGVMHACGHDGHMAMLLGAARILNDIKDDLCGEIKLLFQPGEEIGVGAIAFIEETNLKKIDACFAIHLWQDLEVGKVSVEAGPRMAAADSFTIKINGKSGHGSMPHQTRDAILIGSAVVMNLQSLVSRNIDPLETLVVTIGKFHAGTRSNIITGEAILEGTIRSLDKGIWNIVPNEMKRVINNTCAAYGATAEFKIRRGCPPLVNDEGISEVLGKSAEKLYGNNCLVQYKATTGGEDFAHITRRIPGALAFVGTRNDILGFSAPHHNERFDIDEKSLEVGTNLFAQFAVDFLNKK